MKLIYAREDIPDTILKSIFLAGPTPRSDETESWRKDAVKILEDKGYDGVVFIPEPRDGSWQKNYNAQVEWEEECLNIADCIVFWVPRDLKTMPAFTTNVEFGTWASSGKIVFGAPPKAEKNTYLKYYAKKFNVPVSESLTETLSEAMDMLGEGEERSGGERYVPLFIWKTDSFKKWYEAQTGAGNRLDKARVLYSFRPDFKSFVFMWVLRADVYLKEEERHKTNEFVLSRPDISSVMLWKREENLEDSKVVLIKEFRTPAATSDGFIRELVGGSSKDPEDPEGVAASEVLEETGFKVTPDRLVYHQARQLCGTLSSHKSHFFSVELDDDEVKWFESQEGIVHGNVKDSERTFIEVYTISDLLENEDVDWVTLGQVMLVWTNSN